MVAIAFRGLLSQNDEEEEEEEVFSRSWVRPVV